MKRIEGFEIEEQRKYYLEPKLVEEWSYYVYCYLERKYNDKRLGFRLS